MSSSGNEGTVLLDKIMVSARIPRYVKVYADEHKISISQLVMRGFDSYRETDVEHAIERLSYHEKRVLHWKYIVLQNEQTCNTKQQICNTIKQQFLDQGRGNPETKHRDLTWLQSKAENLVKEGIIVTAQELYNLCIKKEIKK